MRRFWLHGFVILSVSGMTGCGYSYNFPDLWPFDDEPVIGSSTSTPSQLSTPLPDVTSTRETVIVEAPSVSEPSVEAEQPTVSDQPITQLTPALGLADGVTASVPGAVAYIISPADGAVLTNPVRVLFGLDRMGVAPVTSSHDATGHHHLLIDTELPPLDQRIPASDNLRHFSGGQTETTLNLSPGRHTLQLLLGDHEHMPHQPPVISQQITITVQ